MTHGRRTIELFHEVVGDGPPVLLIHGATGDSREYWGAVAPLLAERFRVITYDQRGFGRSPADPAARGIDGLVDDAAALLDHLDAVPAAVVGISLGGIVAQQLAARRPDVVARMVLAATTARIGPRLQLLGSVLSAVAALDDPGLLFDLNTVLCHSDAYLDQHADDVARLRAEVVAADGAAWMARLGPPSPWDGVPAGAIRCPTLLLFGDEDAEMPLRCAHELHERIPQATTAVLRGAGHKVAQEQPEAFARAVGDFLDDHDR